MTALVALPVLTCLVGAALSVGFARHRGVQRTISLAVLAGNLAGAVALVLHVDEHGTQVVDAGGWEAPVGITLVADRLSALLALTVFATLIAGLLHAMGERSVERDRDVFHPVYLVLAAGLSLSLVAGDLFNLFVAFEVTLMASYVLMTLGGGREAVRRGTSYVVINLIASTVFLLLLGLLYAATGTVNLADLSVKIAELPVGLQRSLAVLVLAVFGIKSAIFPLFSWLPDSYPAAATSVAAVFAGLSTKIGIYTLIRTQTLLFTDDIRPGTLLLVIAALTMVIGVAGAVAQTKIAPLLSFHIVSQIGYMLLGLGLFTVRGIAGAIVFTVHQMLVKPALFLVGGLLARRGGTDDLGRLSGFSRTEPVVAGLFLAAGLSLAGIPPLSGFVGKLALVEAGLDARQWAVVGVSLAVSVCTLYSMTKIWSYAFWGTPLADEELQPRGAGWGLMLAGTVLLVVLSLAVVAAAGPLHEYALRAAHDVLDVAGYRRAVLGA